MDDLQVYSSLGEYLNAMGSRGRMVVVNKGNQTIGWATFFLLETVDQAHLFHQRPLWSTFLDSSENEVILIDKLAVNGWNSEIRHLFQREILSIFPHLKTAVWFRPSKTGPDHLVVRPIREEAHATNVLG